MCLSCKFRPYHVLGDPEIAQVSRYDHPNSVHARLHSPLLTPFGRGHLACAPGIAMFHRAAHGVIVAMSPDSVNHKNACRECGAPLSIRKRVYCDGCLPTELARIAKESEPSFQAAGPAKITATRAKGVDPTQSNAARNCVPPRPRSNAEIA